MFYVCVICMVSDKRGPLMKLTDELLQIWERMITPSQPRAKIKKLSLTTLLVCKDCQQLLETIHKFQRTMTIGANYLLSLHKAAEDQERNQPNKNNKKVLIHPVPQLINNKKVLINPLPPLINQSDLWLPVANEEVVESTETCDDIESTKPVATNTGTTNSTKLPLILRRPTVEKLSSQHVPETIGDFAVLIPNGGLRGWKPVHPLGASLLQGPHATERSDATTQNVALKGLNDAKIQIRAPLLKVPPTERNDATAQIRASLIKGPHATERNDLTIKIRASLLQEPHAKQLHDTITQIRAPLSKGPQVRGSINQSDALPEPAHCIRPAMLVAFKEKSNLLCEGDVAYSSEFLETSKIKQAMPIPKDAKKETVKVEPANVSALSEDKIKLNRQLFDTIKAALRASLTEEFDIKYEPEPETGCESTVAGSESRPELGRKLGPKLKRESGPELGSEPDFGRDSDDPDSESTLSCQSDYEDPEYCPNIIFARAFDGIYGVSYDPRIIGKGLDREGKAEDVQIHSHIVTNPPSEWPCTWESCQLQALDDEDEGSESPTNGPPNEQVTRSKRKGYTRRFNCKLCGKSFTQSRVLWEHYEREHATVKCNICPKEFRSDTELKFHKIKHQIKVTAEFEEYAPHLCPACGMRFRGQNALRTHLLTRRHAARALWRFQCDICKRKFPDKKRIAGHIQIEHLAKEAVKCPMCTATFKSARSLRRHATAHILAQAQENMHANTQANGQARKRRRTHTNGKDMQKNGCQDTNRLVNEEDSKDTLRNGRKPRKTTHTKAKTYNKRKTQENGHTDINVQAKKRTAPTNRQRKTDKNTQVRKYNNKQDNTYTYTLNGQESTQAQTHLNGQRNTHTHTYTDIQTNGQINTHNAKGPTHTNTCTDIQNGINTESKITRKRRVRKRRRKCPYTKRKRACTKPPAQEPAVAKTSLFDMLSSFIL